jgi:hypothetical protein
VPGIDKTPIVYLAALLSAVTLTGIAVTAGGQMGAIDELVPTGAPAPVDYGPGPGHGRPKAHDLPSLKLADGRNQMTSATQPTASGTIANIALTTQGRYVSTPTCSIAPQTSPSGAQATCTIMAVGVANFALAFSSHGAGYRVSDTLVVNPMPGLSCAVYPAVQVGGVDGNGAVTALKVGVTGVCSAIPTTGTYVFSGGAGAGYTSPTGINGIQWQVLFASASGSGYTSAPAVTFSSSSLKTAKGVASITPSGPVTATVPAGGPAAGTQGVFGGAVPWPINAIHTTLLPDGRVLDYGTDQNGNQTGAFLYDIWDPSLGTDLGAHMVLPNATLTNIFCSGTSVLWTTGQVLITGGDLTVNGVRNSPINKTTIFTPSTNGLNPGGQMQYPRWYGSVIPLPNGEKLVLGGSLALPPTATGPVQAATTPEIYDPSTGWRTLTGAAQSSVDWYYPRAYVTPAGTIFELSQTGLMSTMNIGGAGTTKNFGTHAPRGSAHLPTVMFATGKLLSVRLASTVIADINGATPVVTPTANLDQLRYDANATLLADGTVLVTGGSTVENVLTGVAYTAQLWSPGTGQWTTGAAAAKPRLYHSNALLLPDASVLTAGGGSPGPIVNLNAEIYYPPYLYAQDGSGNPATRPLIAGVLNPSSTVGVGQTLAFAMGDATQVGRVTLLRSGAATHANNDEQRFLDLTPTMIQNGQQISVTLPANPNVVLPGYWLLFAFNQAGVPSAAQQVLVTN